MNLLIIDDDQVCTVINTWAAKTCGTFKEIRHARNGRQALDIFEQVRQGTVAPPDVVMLDLNMPVMNGFDFIKALRRLNFPNKERLSIVLLTSSDKNSDIRRAKSLGIEHYLLKPLDVKDLQSRLSFLCEQAERSRNLKEERQGYRTFPL